MIWIILVGIVVFILAKIAINTSKDSEDLGRTTLADKFHLIVYMLNKAAFNGEGQVHYLDRKHFNLYPSGGSNQLVEFLYSQGMLSITWKYKYFQKELVYRRNFSNVRNLSLFEQEKIASSIIEWMDVKILEHKSNVHHS